MSEVKVNEEAQEKTAAELEAEEAAMAAEQRSAGEDVQEEQPGGSEAETEEGGENQVVDAEAELARVNEEIAELRDRMLRGAAENENFKKRIERERQASLKYAGETIFREILPVVDNLERAVGQGITEGVDAEKNLKALLEGVELTLKSLVGILEKFEVKPIESVGQPFDPQHQEALTMEATDKVPANHVVTEFEKGYYYKDRLLRAAKVIVSSGESK
ncbi:nucleotide exchange factor GrpE [Desulforhopalus singaporensis]|uniref:Protein GrpE n=1 Tax=Desulforhopalus singaporensis TaxID=91360 RepID=A0A1H0J6Y4_9BACT|nr:nucleotide exchange factor GrpE [Desulforhopalus singaporensis]SDO39270.1 molecular chaperone GrpE [Desulforhopalus singaporensis]